MKKKKIQNPIIESAKPDMEVGKRIDLKISDGIRKRSNAEQKKRKLQSRACIHPSKGEKVRKVGLFYYKNTFKNKKIGYPKYGPKQNQYRNLLPTQK